MDTNIILNNLIEKRIENLECMIINLQKDIDSLGELMEKITISDKYIEEIERINLEIKKMDFPNYYDQEYEDKIKIAIEALKKMINKIDIKKEEINGNIKEINKKEKIINSYIYPKKGSIFIDKNL